MSQDCSQNFSVYIKQRNRSLSRLGPNPGPVTGNCHLGNCDAWCHKMPPMLAVSPYHQRWGSTMAMLCTRTPKRRPSQLGGRPSLLCWLKSWCRSEKNYRLPCTLPAGKGGDHPLSLKSLLGLPRDASAATVSAV